MHVQTDSEDQDALTKLKKKEKYKKCQGFKWLCNFDQSAAEELPKYADSRF